MGNHDRAKDIPKLLEYVDGVAGAIKYKGYMLTHIPIHPNEVNMYRGNIHAHIHHENKLEEIIALSSYNDEGSIPMPTKSKYVCVDAHLIGYKPLTL